GRETVEVVGPADHRKQDHGQRILPVGTGERNDEEYRDQSQPDVADGVRDRPGTQRLIRARLRRWRPRAVEAEQATLGDARAHGASDQGSSRQSWATSPAAPSTGNVRVSRP